jgi:hypothetical protein
MHNYLLGVIALILSVNVNAATVDFYTDRATFESSLLSSNTIDFERFSGSSYELASEFIIDDVTFSTDGSIGGNNELMWSGPEVFGSSADPMESGLLISNGSLPMLIDLTTAGTGFTAVGGFFGDIIDPLNLLTIEVYGMSGLLDTKDLMSASMKADTPSNFFGWIVAGDEITSMRYDLEGNYEGIDDFVFGVATPVPIPAAAWLFGSGLMIFGLVRRKA